MSSPGHFIEVQARICVLDMALAARCIKVLTHAQRAVEIAAQQALLVAAKPSVHLWIHDFLASAYTFTCNLVLSLCSTFMKSDM